VNVAKDPVCGMTVLQDGSLKLHYGGHDVYFCSVFCKASFEQEPSKYLTRLASETTGETLERIRIAYFSMEVALGNDMHTDSGGLGVLAGDTLKSAADLRVPVVGVSLLSRKGYFRQELDDWGNQRESPADWDPARFLEPLSAVAEVNIEGRVVKVTGWKYQLVGAGGYAVPVIFLDTDLEGNSDYDRSLTDRLYGGDDRYRLAQECVLGVGGVRIAEARIRRHREVSHERRARRASGRGAPPGDSCPPRASPWALPGGRRPTSGRIWSFTTSSDYGELFVKRREGRRFSTQDLRDLQMWSNLAWFGKEFREGEVELATGETASVRDLVAKGRGFTARDIEGMIAEQFKILRAVIPLHRALQDEGRIEVVTTPFAHPILPLIVDTDEATIDRPTAKHPARFHHPEDADAQVALAVRLYRDCFGASPEGMWPAEGAVSASTVPIYARNGVRWIASDEGVLSRSGRWGYDVGDPHVLCRPYRTDC